MLLSGEAGIGKSRLVDEFRRALAEALAVANELQPEGWEIEVVDLRTVKPLDTDTVVASARSPESNFLAVRTIFRGEEGRVRARCPRSPTTLPASIGAAKNRSGCWREE